MRLTVTRGELRDAVQGFAKIITGKTNLAVLGCVRFSVEGGDLTAQATDLDQTAIYRFGNAEAGGEGAVIIPLQLLRDLGKGAATETVTLESEGADINVTNNVGGHAITRTVAGADDADWPPAGTDIAVSEARGFLKAYRRMAPFASTDETRRGICCVNIDVGGDGEHNATLVATDGRRLTCCNSLKLPVDGNGVMVPVTRFLLWQGLQEDAMLGVSRSRDCTRIGVRAGQWTYRVKAVEGVYPNWRQVLPHGDGMEHSMTFTDPDVEALRKILPSFPGADAVTLDGSANGTLSLKGSDRDAARELTVPLTAGSAYKGPGGRFTANRNYLLDALNAGFRNFRFCDGASPLLSEDGNGATHVLMPLRLEGPRRPLQEAAPAEQAASSETSTTTAAATAPAPEQAKEKQEMTNATQTKAQASQPNAQEQTALEKLQAAYDTAKNRVREAQSALSDVAAAIRDAVREDRLRRAEVESVRSGLAKLQSIKV